MMDTEPRRRKKKEEKKEKGNKTKPQYEQSLSHICFFSDPASGTSRAVHLGARRPSHASQRRSPDPSSLCRRRLCMYSTYSTYSTCSTNSTLPCRTISRKNKRHTWTNKILGSLPPAGTTEGRSPATPPLHHSLADSSCPPPDSSSGTAPAHPLDIIHSLTHSSLITPLLPHASQPSRRATCHMRCPPLCDSCRFLRLATNRPVSSF